ncbi:ABC transporter permease, partial [Cereibacter changlensis]
MAIHNRPLCLLALLLLVGALALPFLSHAPNRLISGQPVPLWALGSGAWLVLLPGLALLAGP